MLSPMGARSVPAPQLSGRAGAPRHVALLSSLDSIPSLPILKPYSFPVPLIRNANDVMKLDRSVAFSS